jgi:hypothetical protein
MSQNTSHAVMAQRSEPHDSLDFFPTPPWATRALFEHVLYAKTFKDQHLWDPACGDGAMVRVLFEYSRHALGSDVHNYGEGFRSHDFLLPFVPWEGWRPDWIITNPPFRLAEQFVWHGLEIAERGVAVLVRSVFIESIGRYKNLFKTRQPAVMAQFVERVPMVKGRLDKAAVTATSYCWLVWTRRQRAIATELIWIPPCRGQLERPGDYD